MSDLAKLLVVSGPLKGEEFPIEGRMFTIGRRDDNDLVIPERFISRKHAEITANGAAFVIRGLSKKNPVLVNRKPVSESRLQHGDRIEICGTKLKFTIEPNDVGRARAEPQRRRRTLGPGSDIGETVRYHSDELPPADELPPSSLDDPDAPEPGPAERFVFDDSDENIAPARPEPRARARGGRERADDRALTTTAPPDKRGSADRGLPRYADAGVGSSEGTGEIDMKEVLEGSRTGKPKPPAPAREKTREEALDELDDLDDDVEDVRPVRPQKELPEKVVKALIGVCIVGIVVVLGLFVYFDATDTANVYPEKIHDLQIGLPRHLTEQWTEENPVAGIFDVGKDAEGKTVYIPVALGDIIGPRKSVLGRNGSVELTLILTRNKLTHLLAVPKAEGRLEVQLRFKNGDRKPLKLEVRGKAKRLQEAEAWREKIDQQGQAGELKTLMLIARSHKNAADELWAERDAPAKEGNRARALEQYAKAVTVIEVMRTYQPGFDPELDKLEEATDEAQRQAKREFEERLERTKARFWEAYKNGETSQARDEAEAIKLLIDDEDDKDWIRYDVLLEYLIGGKK